MFDNVNNSKMYFFLEYSTEMKTTRNQESESAFWQKINK